MLAAIGLRTVRRLVIGEECPGASRTRPPTWRRWPLARHRARAAIAFEDSPRAARRRASGAYTVGIRSAAGGRDLRAAGAHVTIADFTDPALPDILSRLRKEPRMTRTIVESRTKDHDHRLRPAVLRDRRADQPHGPQEAAAELEGGRFHSRGGRRGPGRRRGDRARHQRRAWSTTPTPNAQRDRTAADDARSSSWSRPWMCRSASTARCPARWKRPCRRPWPPAAELRHRRGRAARTRAAAGQEIQRAGRGDLERRHRHLRRPGCAFRRGRKIVERAADFGIPAHDIVVDPLVMPIGAMGTAGARSSPWCAAA